MSEQLWKGELEATQQIKFFETLLRASTDGIVITDATQSIVLANEAFCALLGRRRQDVIETSLSVWLEQLDAGAAMRWDELEQRVYREGDCRDVEFQIQRAGGVRHISVNASPLEQVAGEEAGFIMSTWRDVTERVRAEQALRESEERFRDLYENAPNAYFSVGADGLIRRYNKHAGELLGYAVEDMVGRPVFELYANTSQGKEKASRVFQQFQAGEMITDKELQMQKADGTPVWISLTVNVVRDSQGRVVESRSMVVDITRRKQAEEALLREKDNLVRVFEAIQDGIYVVDQQYNIQYVNPVLVKDFGPYEGRKCYKYFHDQEKACSWCKNRDVFAGKTVRWEWYSLKSQRTYDLIDTPLKNADGSLSKLEIFRDITERKWAEDELQRLYEQARQNAETKALLLREVNHRVKNNMASILGILALEMQRSQQENINAQVILQDLQNRILGLSTIHDLLSAAQWSPLPLDELLTKVIQAALSASPIHHKIELSVRAAAEPLLVTPYQATSLALVFNELTTNSIKHAFAGRSQGRIDVRITTGQDQAGGVTLRFRDDGPGWPDDVLRGARENIGLNVVRMTVRGSLRGQLTLSNADTDSGRSGAVASMTIKLAETL